MGRQGKNNSKTRFLCGGADAQQALDLRLLCSKLSPDSKWTLCGPCYSSKQGKQRNCRKGWWGSIQSQTGPAVPWPSQILSFAKSRDGMSWGLKAVLEVKCLIQTSLVSCSHHHYFCWKPDFDYKKRSFKDHLPWPLRVGFQTACLFQLSDSRGAGRQALDNRRKSKTDHQQLSMQIRFIKT